MGAQTSNEVRVNRYLLDTNVVSQLRKNKPHGAVLSWFSGLQDTQIYLSAVTLGELQAGVELTRQLDVAKAEQIEEWARLMSGKPNRLIPDAMIAAIARVHQLIVASRNERDFGQLSVQVFNPFTS